MRVRRRGRLLALLVMGLAAVAAVGLSLAGPVAAANSGVDVVAEATYTVEPSADKVRVDIDVTVGNSKPDPVEWFGLAIHGGANGVVATGGGRDLQIVTSRSSGWLGLEVDLGHGLTAGRRERVHVAYSLEGGPPRSSSDVRVGAAFVSFHAWAFGTSGSVRVLFPLGFSPETQDEPMVPARDDEHQVLSADHITDTQLWTAWITAERPASLQVNRIRVDAGGSTRTVVVRSWPEDAAWATRVTRLLQRGVPALAGLVGWSWAAPEDLTITEVYTPVLDGYAGFYRTASNTIQLSEDLDPLTVVHEASHAWFNESLFSDRWVTEGLADAVSAQLLVNMGETVPQEHAISATGGAAFPLESWGPPTRIADQATDDRENYGYEASRHVVAGLIDDVGLDKLGSVLRAAHGGASPYGISGPAEAGGPSTTGWRSFLDLLDEKAGATRADGLIRTWVATPGDQKVLDDRSAARAALASLRASMAGWTVPAAVLRPLAAWDFKAAKVAIANATDILTRREANRTLAQQLGITIDEASLRDRFQAADVDFGDALWIVNQEAGALRAIALAAASLDQPRDAFTTLGLLVNEAPGPAVERARAAFAAGFYVPAGDDAGRVGQILAGAADTGRLIVAGVTTGIVATAFPVVFFAVRRRRRRVLSAASAEVPAPATAGPGSAVVPAPATAAPPDETTPAAAASAEVPVPATAMRGSNATSEPPPADPPAGEIAPPESPAGPSTAEPAATLPASVEAASPPNAGSIEQGAALQP